MKAPKFPVPLTATYAHDVKAMLKAHPSPGAYYIVNPNNPTGTMTPREDIVWLLKNKPAGSVVIVDEAYHHFSEHESVLDQVAADKDIIVLRTFSKIYGMAGIRAGFAAARPDLLAKFNTVAAAGTQPGEHLHRQRRRSYAPACRTRSWCRCAARSTRTSASETLEFLTKHGYKIVPGSQANMFMVDVKRPGREFTARDDEGERGHRPFLVGDAELRSRHRRHQGRDGEVPDGLREVHGHGSGHRQWCRAAHARVPHPVGAVSRLTDWQIVSRKRAPVASAGAFFCLCPQSSWTAQKLTARRGKLAFIMELMGCGTALVTPFRRDRQRGRDLRCDALVNWQIESGIGFLVPCGTTGEAATLSEAGVAARG